MNLKLMYCFILFSITSIVKSQNDAHWLVNKDAVTDCSLLKSAKFLNQETESKVTEGYAIEFKGNFVIETIENGKYFLKCSIVFDTKCSYTLTVLETTVPGYENQIGTKIETEILETSKVDNLVKIRSREPDGEWITLVFKKIVKN